MYKPLAYPPRKAQNCYKHRTPGTLICDSRHAVILDLWASLDSQIQCKSSIKALRAALLCSQERVAGGQLPTEITAVEGRLSYFTPFPLDSLPERAFEQGVEHIKTREEN